jgi:ArsR family transcriptional regulator
MIITDRIEANKILAAVNMLKVIAHPVRLAILDLLTENSRMTVLEIQEALNLEQAIASQHLTLMEDKGVLISEKVSRNK